MPNVNVNSHLGYHINSLLGWIGMFLIGIGMHAAARGKGLIPLLNDIRFAYGAISVGLILAVVWLFGFVKYIKRNKSVNTRDQAKT